MSVGLLTHASGLHGPRLISAFSGFPNDWFSSKISDSTHTATVPSGILTRFPCSFILLLPQYDHRRFVLLSERILTFSYLPVNCVAVIKLLIILLVQYYDILIVLDNDLWKDMLIDGITEMSKWFIPCFDLWICYLSHKKRPISDIRQSVLHHVSIFNFEPWVFLKCWVHLHPMREYPHLPVFPQTSQTNLV